MRRRAGQEVYPWDTIRRDFIEGTPVHGTKNERVWMNLRELAEAHGVPYDRIRKKAAKERWSEHKSSHQVIAEQERARVRAKQIATNALDFDEKSFNAAKMGMGLVMTRLGEMAQEVQVKRKDREDALARAAQGLPVSREELYSAVNANHLNELAVAAERFQSLGMKALGTDVQRVDIQGMGDTTVNVVNVTSELKRDDVDRSVGVIGAMIEAGLFPDEVAAALTAPVPEDQDDDNTIDGEVVEDGTDADDEVEAEAEPNESDV